MTSDRSEKRKKTMRKQTQMCFLLILLSLTAFTLKNVQAKEIVIGMSFPAADHGWLGAVITNAENQAKALGVKSIITTADNPNKQIGDIEDLITQKVDAIVMLPIESESMTPAAKKIKDAGIPLVVFDRELYTQDYTDLIKGDNKGIGLNAAKFIGKKLNGHGNVALLTLPPSSVNSLRVEGVTEGFKEFPDIKLVANLGGPSTKESGFNIMQNMLQAQKEINAVICLDDEMALGALKAIQEAKRTDITILTAAGGDKEFYEAIKDAKGITLVTFLYSPVMVKDCVKAAVEIVKGNTPKEKTTVIPAAQVDAENVDKYYDPQSNY